jgi:uncharacterized protein
MMFVAIDSLARTVLLAAGRLIFAFLLVVVQLYVLRAFLRMIRSLALDARREKILIAATILGVTILNFPLLLFIAESIVHPHGLFLYAPSPGFEVEARPLAYVFFIWTVGSIMFSAAAPAVMACFALVQFFRRRQDPENEGPIEVFDLSRRRFLRLALIAAAGMPFAVSAYGAIAARSRKVVERVVIPIPGLPPQLDGLSIVQMSDIHSGLFMTEARMREHAAVASSLEPDIIALTGDFVATGRDQVAPFMRAFSGLKAKYGAFACLGNHDIFTHSEEALERGFSELGINLLRNENQTIDVNGARLNILGVDYFFGPRGNTYRLDRALESLPLDGTTILLMHAPQAFAHVAKTGIDLTLSGHTHGGQIALSIGDLILTPARLSTMFLAGLFKIGDSHLYVNRGLGTTGPPIRINAPPEITHITLTATNN